MKVTTYKIELYLNKLSKSSNQAPIRLRITKDRRSSYRTLSHVEPEFWDTKKECVKKHHPNAGELNALIETRMADIKKEVSLLEITDSTTCMSTIRSKLNNSTSYNLYKHADEVMEHLQKEGQYATYRKYKSVIKKLRKYTAKDNLPISSVTSTFIKQYENHLLNEKKNNRNTTNVNLKVIARLVNDIYRDKKLDKTNNPFTSIKFKREKTERTFLEAKEVKRIENLRIRIRSKLYDAKDVFLIECYTGLRISDILTLRWDNYTEERISIRMRKTDKTITIPVSESVKEIIGRRRRILENNGIQITPDRYIFNILRVDVNKISAQDALNAISSATAVINRNLKEIAKRAEINKNISTHVARHTFATLLISMDANLFVTRDLLGHSDIRVTQEYVKVLDKDKIRAINSLNNL